jgi:hypothetical protein
MVKGTKFVPTEKYFVKLEGARRIGYRTFSVAGVKDPVMIENIDEIVQKVKDRVKDNFGTYGIKNFYLDFKIYGRNGVMGIFSGIDNRKAHELAIIIDAVAPTQEQSDTICGFARSTMLHMGYDGRISTAGNLAFPFSPSDAHMGAVYEFNIYHLMEVKDPAELFPVRYIKINGRK